jgi:hypothetical protein
MIKISIETVSSASSTREGNSGKTSGQTTTSSTTTSPTNIGKPAGK